jgi:hypothetical protein
LGERSLDIGVFVKEGTLFMEPSGEAASPLLYQGGHTFVAAADRGIRVVFVLEGERTVAMVVHQNGQELRGERKLEARGSD